MNEEHDPQLDVPDELAARLADPSTWEPAPAGALDAILAGIAEEKAAAEPAAEIGSPTAEAPVDVDQPLADVIDLSERRRRWAVPFAAGIAAGVTLLAIVGALLGFDNQRDADEFASEFPTVAVELNATDLAPDAGAQVELSDTPLGTFIRLDVAGLPPAEEGTYYEAWMKGDGGAVSAGTFHLRGGDGDIILWTGVPVADFPKFKITVQDIGDPLPSPLVVLTSEPS